MRYAIYKERRLVVTTGWERVTFEEIRAHQEQVLSDPDFSSDFDQLVDGTRATALDISASEAQIVVGRRIFSPSARRALVAPAAAVYGMGRLLETYNEMSVAPSQIRVFYDLSSALKWLGLEGIDLSKE